MLRKYVPVLVLTLGMLIQASPASLRALELAPGGLLPVSIPARTATVFPIPQADLDGDGTAETLALTGGRLSIFSDAETVWQSPPDWQIVQAAFSDLNHDRQPEVTILLWRPFRPWPVDQWLPDGGRIAGFHNAAGQSCHLILIGWIRGGYHELWAGSAMAEPVTSFKIADLNNDTLQELVTLEGRYTDQESAPAHILKAWEWNGFGFTVVSSMYGTFSNIALVKTRAGPILILVP